MIPYDMNTECLNCLFFLPQQTSHTNFPIYNKSKKMFKNMVKGSRLSSTVVFEMTVESTFLVNKSETVFM